MSDTDYLRGLHGAHEDEVVAEPRIHTDRLVLDRLVAGDAPSLFEYRSHADVRRYQGWDPASLEDAARFIESLGSVAFDTPGTWFQLAVRLRDSPTLIGDVGVHFLEDERQAEVGFTLSPRHQGSGLATEAVAAVLDTLFGELRKHRVTASIDPRNERSIRLARRLGMRQEAHFRESLWFRGEWADDLVFALLSREWRQARSTGAS